MTVELCFAFSSKRAARQAAEAFGGVLYETLRTGCTISPLLRCSAQIIQI